MLLLSSSILNDDVFPKTKRLYKTFSCVSRLLYTLLTRVHNLFVRQTSMVTSFVFIYGRS